MAAMYLCVGCIDIASFYDFPIEIWNSSDSVVFFLFSDKYVLSTPFV
jgi:hypothetical protein